MTSANLQLICRGALLCSMLFALVTSLLNYRLLDKAMKIFAAYIAVSFLDETLAYVVALIFRNNYPVYFAYGIVEIVLLCLFFNYTIDVFRRNSYGIYLGIICALLGLIDGLFIQSIYTVNHYFLFIESIVIISVALFFFARVMLTLKPDQLVYRSPYFLVACLLTFFWTSNFFSWGLAYYNAQPDNPFLKPVGYMICGVNVVYYTGIGIVFLLYPQLCKEK